MCGRYRLSRAEALAQRFALEKLARTPAARFNVAPTQQVAVVFDESPDTLSVARWGLIPSWAKDRKNGNSLINARAETVATKPAFRSAFTKRRCWILSDGFYEWQRPEKGPKIPPRFHAAQRRAFCVCGTLGGVEGKRRCRTPAHLLNHHDRCK